MFYADDEVIVYVDIDVDGLDVIETVVKFDMLVDVNILDDEEVLVDVNFLVEVDELGDADVFIGEDVIECSCYY